MTLMGKKTDRQKAKTKAWDAFSLYIRTRDCLRFRSSLTDGVCVTCNRDYPLKQLQAGHFISGRGNAVLFDERIVYSQCIGCNGNPPYGKGGNYVEYFVFMEKEWGREMIDEFRALKHQTKIYKTFDFVALEQEFKDKRQALVDKHLTSVK
jgi:hypothetical protein